MNRILSVTQLSDYIAGIMAHDPLLRNIKIWGEISNFRETRSGHAYFSLKDETAVIQCACFQSALDALSFSPEDGQHVHAYGYVSIYSQSGQMQLYVQDMEPVGMGQLYERFEALKEELANRGYFAQERKRSIPTYPQCIGIVTSPNGAVLHDIAQVAWRRNPGQAFLLAPAKVQGQGAAEEVAASIDALNCFHEVDVIILARGGGSLEDLWAMNERIVAEAIYRSEKPVISAVGHETDFSIADFVSDLRAPTPSAAAELSTPLTAHSRIELESLANRLQLAVNKDMEKQKQQQLLIKNRLLMQSPLQGLQQQWQRIDILTERLLTKAQTAISERQRYLETMQIRLNSLGPNSLLERGYALIQRKGKVIRSAGELRSGESVELLFRDGTATANVQEVRKKDS